MTGGKKIQIQLAHVGEKIKIKNKKKTLLKLIKRTHSLLSHITNPLQAVRGTAEIVVINIT